MPLIKPKPRKMSQDDDMDPFVEQKNRMDAEQDEKDQENQDVDNSAEDSIEAAKEHNFAKGGMVDKPKSIAEAVMRKRKMAKGGEVDGYDEQDHEAFLKENYKEDLFPVVPGSNEMGDEEESKVESKLGMIQSIRQKLKAKRGF